MSALLSRHFARTDNADFAFAFDVDNDQNVSSADSPIVTNLCSSIECSGSGIVDESESVNPVEASLKETTCFSELAAAFSSSYSH